jgi:hypothetical protein
MHKVAPLLPVRAFEMRISLELFNHSAGKNATERI